MPVKQTALKFSTMTIVLQQNKPVVSCELKNFKKYQNKTQIVSKEVI